MPGVPRSGAPIVVVAVSTVLSGTFLATRRRRLRQLHPVWLVPLFRVELAGAIVSRECLQCDGFRTRLAEGSLGCVQQVGADSSSRRSGTTNRLLTTPRVRSRS